MGMPKYERLLHILNLLRSRKNLNAESLARECGVTERSIYRDILALSEASIPIYYDRGYKLASDCFLPPLNFEFEEYRFLQITLDATPLTRTDKYAPVAREVRAKIDAALSEQVRRQKRFTPRTTHIEPAVPLVDTKAEKFFAVIEEGITRYRCLDLEYDSISSGNTRRVIEPYFIVFRGRAFYFVAFCRLRDDFRTFRMDRIIDVTLTDHQFVKQEGVDPDTYFEHSWEVYSGEPTRVVLRLTGAAAKVVRTTTHHAGEEVELLADGSVRYTVVTRGLEEIQRWILGFGSDAEVLAPDELRSALRDVGEYLRQTYGADQ